MDVVTKFSFPHRVEYRSLPLTVDLVERADHHVKMVRWCWANLGLSDWTHDPTGIEFKYQEDLTWFLVTWT